MNNLLKLRKEAGLTIRKIEQLTGISYATITWLEKGKRPFRQVHLDKLSSFFNVTTDYLLGNSNTGYILNYKKGIDTLTVSEEEYHALLPNIELSIIKLADNDHSFTVGKETVYFPKFCVYRELKNDADTSNLKDVKIRELTNVLRTMNAHELELVDKFIKEFILKKSGG